MLHITLANGLEPGIPPRFLTRLTASLRCLGCKGPVSPHCSITSNAESKECHQKSEISDQLTYKGNSKSTVFNNFSNKHLGYTSHCDNHILRYTASCNCLHYLENKKLGSKYLVSILWNKYSFDCSFREGRSTVHFIAIQLLFGEIGYQNLHFFSVFFFCFPFISHF